MEKIRIGIFNQNFFKKYNITMLYYCSKKIDSPERSRTAVSIDSPERSRTAVSGSKA